MKIQARVQGVYQGHSGRYAVATAKGVHGSITFSLTPPVWTETGEPEPGQIVILNDLRRKQAGWRAYIARFLRLEDEVNSISIPTKGASIEHQNQYKGSGQAAGPTSAERGPASLRR